MDIGYDTKEILLSKAGVAISGFIIKKQIQQKIKKSPFMNSVTDDEGTINDYMKLALILMHYKIYHF